MRFRPADVAHLHCFVPKLWQEDWLVPVLDTMAMGDLNSVAFGQTSHLSVILRTQMLGLGDFISLKGRPHRGRIHAGLLIDDFVLLEQVPKDRDKACPSPGRKVIQKIRDMYEQVGLPRHPGKAVEQAEIAEFWGAEVNGVEGRVRANLKRAIPLVHVLLRVVRLGRSTVSLLEVLAGALVACFQFRRRFMSMLHEIYCAQRGRQRDDIVVFSKQLKDELLCCAGLVVLSGFNLRLKPSRFLVATDASSTTRAAVSAEIGEVATKELQRHGLQKGLWNRLLSPEKAWMREHLMLEPDEELPDSDSYKMHPIWEEVVSSQTFSKFGLVRRQRGREHINVGEVAAALEAERERGRRWPGHFFINLQDSLVSLACLVKGRSSSWQINKLLRQSIADVCAWDSRAPGR